MNYNLSNNQNAEMLRNCLEASIHGTVGMFLHQFSAKGGKLIGEPLVVLSRVTERCRNIIQFASEEYCYFEFSFPSDKDSDLLAMMNIYKQYLKRSTEAFVKDESEYENTYVFETEIISIKGDITYRIVSTNPVYVISNENKIVVIAKIEDFMYGSDKIDYSDVDAQLEYEAKAKAEEHEKEYNDMVKNNTTYQPEDMREDYSGYENTDESGSNASDE